MPRWGKLYVIPLAGSERGIKIPFEYALPEGATRSWDTSPEATSGVFRWMRDTWKIEGNGNTAAMEVPERVMTLIKNDKEMMDREVNNFHPLLSNSPYVQVGRRQPGNEVRFPSPFEMTGHMVSIEGGIVHSFPRQDGPCVLAIGIMELNLEPQFDYLKVRCSADLVAYLVAKMWKNIGSRKDKWFVLKKLHQAYLKDGPGALSVWCHRNAPKLFSLYTQFGEENNSTEERVLQLMRNFIRNNKDGLIV